MKLATRSVGDKNYKKEGAITISQGIYMTLLNVILTIIHKENSNRAI